jgi:hypothetical protein
MPLLTNEDTGSVKEQRSPFGDRVDPFGAVSEPALAADLRLLMRGPGARSGQDRSRIGPALRTMCGIASSDSTADAIAAVAAWLHTRISTLGSDTQRTYALLAFGLDESALLPWARLRLAVGAENLGQSVDTARRAALAAVTAIAGTTTPSQSVPLQLRRHSGSWIDLGIAPGTTTPDNAPIDRRHDRHDDSHGGGHDVLTARCFLIVVARPVDQWDKVYAVIHYQTRHHVASAIPAVRVRHVTPVSHTGSDPPHLRNREQ